MMKKEDKLPSNEPTRILDMQDKTIEIFDIIDDLKNLPKYDDIHQINNYKRKFDYMKEKIRSLNIMTQKIAISYDSIESSKKDLQNAIKLIKISSDMEISLNFKKLQRVNADNSDLIKKSNDLSQEVLLLKNSILAKDTEISRLNDAIQHKKPVNTYTKSKLLKCNSRPTTCTKKDKLVVIDLHNEIVSLKNELYTEKKVKTDFQNKIHEKDVTINSLKHEINCLLEKSHQNNLNFKLREKELSEKSVLMEVELKDKLKINDINTNKALIEFKKEKELLKSYCNKVKAYESSLNEVELGQKQTNEILDRKLIEIKNKDTEFNILITQIDSKSDILNKKELDIAQIESSISLQKSIIVKKQQSNEDQKIEIETERTNLIKIKEELEHSKIRLHESTLKLKEKEEELEHNKSLSLKEYFSSIKTKIEQLDSMLINKQHELLLLDKKIQTQHY